MKCEPAESRAATTTRAMLTKQRSYMKESEMDTLDMLEDLDRRKVFIKTMEESVQNQICHMYLQSKDHVITHGSEHKITLDYLRDLADVLIEHRHLASAATILDRVCLGCKRCYGSKHVNVALVLSRQGLALGSDRKFNESFVCYEKSLLLLEELFDFRLYYSAEHRKDERNRPDTIIVVPTIAVPVIDGLGLALGMLERHRESEFCYRTLMNYYISTDPSIDRTNEPFLPADPTVPLGRRHPEALKAINKLAKALQAQGKFREAEILCGDSLDDCVLALGANHPTTQTSVVTMAQLKHSQGKTAEAEEMYRKSLACNEEVLGLNHIETLANVMQIADLRAEQKDYRGAQFMYERALAGYELVLGPHNSTTIDAVHCIGAMLVKQQRPTAALVMLDRALDVRNGYFGEAHPITLATLFCVGKAYHLESLWKHRPDYTEIVTKALTTLQTSLAGFDAALGKDSIQSIECCEYLSEVLLQCNKFSTAVAYSRRVYAYYHHSGGGGEPQEKGKKGAKSDPGVGGIKVVYGPMHKRTAEAAYQLATLLENSANESGVNDSDKHTEAANLFMQAHEAYRLMLDRLSRDAAYCERNRDRRRYGYNYDSAEGKVPDEEVSLEELEELIDDAMEQHQHALRRSFY